MALSEQLGMNQKCSTYKLLKQHQFHMFTELHIIRLGENSEIEGPCCRKHSL